MFSLIATAPASAGSLGDRDLRAENPSSSSKPHRLRLARFVRAVPSQGFGQNTSAIIERWQITRRQAVCV